MILIQGEYCRVREMKESDAADVVAWRNRPEVARWLIQWTPLTVESHLAWFPRARAAGDLLLVFELPDGTAVGTASVYGFDHPRKMAEWGRLCSAELGSHPFALVEAALLTHRLAFEVLGLERMHAFYDVSNAGARNLNASLGYRLEGVRRQHLATPEGYKDVQNIGLLRGEFDEACAKLAARLHRGANPPEPTAEGRALPETLAARVG